jgi:hypothetical protein
VPPGSTNTERHYRSSVGAGERASPAGMGVLRSTQSLEAEVDKLHAALLAEREMCPWAISKYFGD